MPHFNITNTRNICPHIFSQLNSVAAQRSTSSADGGDFFRISDFFFFPSRFKNYKADWASTVLRCSSVIKLPLL